MSKSDIGKVFSSSSDSDDYSSASAIKKALPKTSLKIPQTSASETERSAGAAKDSTADDIDLSKYKLIDSKQYPGIAKNSKLIYIKTTGKRIQNKYFKKIDPITSSIVIGFYLSDKRNYSEKVSNIEQLYILTKDADQIVEDPLKDTIELKSAQWKALRRDTILSYEKKDGEWVYSAKFNAFIKSPKDQSTRMSMTSERGFNFTLNPTNVSKIYRHISGNDKTITIILQNFQHLAQKVDAIEKKLSKLDLRLGSIERKINGSAKH